MKRQRRAFTLAELVIAVAIMVVIGASVAGVSVALSSAYADSEDRYQSLQCSRYFLQWISSDLRNAKLVTGATSDTLILWGSDGRDTGYINISEVVILRYDSSSGSLVESKVVFPSSMSSWYRTLLDYRMDVSWMTSYGNVHAAMAATGYLKDTTLVSGVTDFQAACQPLPPKTELVKLQVTLGSGASATTLRTAASIRLDKTANLSQSGGAWYLNP